jgi:phosphatidylglycerol:prolipoprotein diacylglycerol transferase
MYFIFNGIERFFIEKIRVNDFFDLGFMTITQAEIIALCFVLFGVILLLLIRSGKIPAPKLPTKKEIGVSPSEL